MAKLLIEVHETQVNRPMRHIASFLIVEDCAQFVHERRNGHLFITIEGDTVLNGAHYQISAMSIQAICDKIESALYT